MQLDLHHEISVVMCMLWRRRLIKRGPGSNAIREAERDLDRVNCVADQGPYMLDVGAPNMKLLLGETKAESDKSEQWGIVLTIRDLACWVGCSSVVLRTITSAVGLNMWLRGMTWEISGGLVMKVILS